MRDANKLASIDAFVRRINTPLGLFYVAATDEAVILGVFANSIANCREFLARRHGVTLRTGTPTPQSGRRLKDAERALSRYFNGDSSALAKTTVRPLGTAFQRSLWRALKKIPAGKTESYLALAKSIGAPKAVRAVGQACGANPICLFIPCHRAVAVNGALHGFSAGLSRKVDLLELEGFDVSRKTDLRKAILRTAVEKKRSTRTGSTSRQAHRR